MFLFRFLAIVFIFVSQGLAFDFFRVRLEKMIEHNPEADRPFIRFCYLILMPLLFISFFFVLGLLFWGEMYE